MIQIKNLTKTFGAFTAVSDLSFEVKAGEVLGFLGPNGAGKSTTMKMITGFLAPTSGDVKICDIEMSESALEAKKQIGYLPEGAPSYGDMTVKGFLDFIAEVRGFKGQDKALKVKNVMEKVRLQKVEHQKIETLSKGFKRRVGLAQAIIHDPKVLILDEPTDGLDPNQKHQVRLLINNLAKDKIVIISTHILEEVTAVCTRALIIADGRILVDETPQALEARSKYHNSVHLTFETEIPSDVVADLETLEGVKAIELSEETPSIRVFPSTQVSLLRSISQLAHQKQWAIKDIYVEKGRLDEVFMNLTQEVA